MEASIVEIEAWGVAEASSDLALSPPLLTAVIVLLVGVGMLQQTSLDALARRSSLVAQLRFAVTLQDLRTVLVCVFEGAVVVGKVRFGSLTARHPALLLTCAR